MYPFSGGFVEFFCFFWCLSKLFVVCCFLSKSWICKECGTCKLKGVVVRWAGAQKGRDVTSPTKPEGQLVLPGRSLDDCFANHQWSVVVIIEYNDSVDCV